jgi:hypothetical protein
MRDLKQALGKFVVGRTTSRVGILLVVSFASVGAHSSLGSDDSGERAFLTEIYKAYVGKNAKGISISDMRKLERYFTPELAKLMADDAAAAERRGEVGELDGDPFIDAQDWDVASFTVEIKKQDSSHATGLVNFKNGDTPKQVVVKLVRLAVGWRIADIDWGEATLTSLFKKH